MSGMATLDFSFAGGTAPAAFEPVLVGVVASGNLEVLVEPAPTQAACSFRIETSARGFDTIWAAVLGNFHDRHRLAGVLISVNDMGATPAVVSLRLDQAVASLREAAP